MKLPLISSGTLLVEKPLGIVFSYQKHIHSISTAQDNEQTLQSEEVVWVELDTALLGWVVLETRCVGLAVSDSWLQKNLK